MSDEYTTFKHRNQDIGLYGKITFESYGDTDEGGFHTVHTYEVCETYTESGVTRVIFYFHEKSSDCDGLYEATGVEYLYVKDGQIIRTERVKSRNRDHSAEAMNY